jgi:hypothetical protein
MRVRVWSPARRLPTLALDCIDVALRT